MMINIGTIIYMIEIVWNLTWLFNRTKVVQIRRMFFISFGFITYNYLLLLFLCIFFTCF